MNKPIYPQIKVETHENIQMRLTTFLRLQSMADGLFYLIEHSAIYHIPPSEYNIFEATIRNVNRFHEEVYKSSFLYIIDPKNNNIEGLKKPLLEIDKNQQSETQRIHSIYTRIEHKMNPNE